MAAPRPTHFDYTILGLEPHAPTALCIAHHTHLTRILDPRHRPPDEQDVWITIQNTMDESLSLIVDAATAWGRRAA